MKTLKNKSIWIVGSAHLLLLGCSANAPKNKPTSQVTVTTSVLPDTPIGYEWVKLDNMSDEFSGSSLDADKWLPYIPTWKNGRPPGQFFPDNVSVAGGNLKLKTSTHPNPNDKYTMGGTSVSGIHQATYGYFESRIKASKVKMSTTFWLHSDSDEDKELGCDRRHGIEIDILETLGGWPTDNWANFMNSNTHYKPSSVQNGQCSGAPYLSKGIKHDSGAKLAQDFNTFGAWWVSPNQVHFYFNGEKTGTVNLDHTKDPIPFDGPMSLRMVVETYYWQTEWIPQGQAPYPTNAELDDLTINTAYYDYVRSYDLRASKSNLVQNPDFEISSSWTLSDKNSRYSNARYSNARLHSYTKSRGLVISDNGSASQNVVVNKNTNYVFGVYAKNLHSGEGAKLVVEDAAGQVLGTIRVQGETFDYFQIPFNSGQSGEVILKIMGNSHQHTVLDNVSLTPQN